MVSRRPFYSINFDRKFDSNAAYGELNSPSNELTRDALSQRELYNSFDVTPRLAVKETCVSFALTLILALPANLPGVD